MKKIALIILICIQAIAFSSCLTTKQTNLLRDTGGSIPAYPAIESVGEYRIKSGDELQVYITTSVFDLRTAKLFNLFSLVNSVGLNNENTNKLRSFSVRTDGTIYFPYLGNIPVEGKTTLEIRELLRQKISENIAEDCIVNVYLGNRYFSVIGESGVGRYPIAKEQTTIFQALSQSRDIKMYGNRSKVKIIRQTEQGSVIKTFDIRSKDIVNSEFYYIQPNDVIYIEPLGRQFLGLDSFGSIFAVLTTISSVGFAVYSLVKN